MPPIDDRLITCPWRCARNRGRTARVTFNFNAWGSYAALITDITIGKDDSIQLDRMVCAVDCDVAVNPDDVEAQIQGGLVYGPTAALYGTLTFESGRVVQGNFHDAQTETPPQARTNGSLFDPIGSVVTHPCCIGCQPSEAPHQTDAVRPHRQRVARGAAGHGSVVLQCSACHQAGNSPEGKVPGAPHWHLAPLSMNRAGLTKGQICEPLEDPRRNGDRSTAQQVIEHTREDKLVPWAWQPGKDRSTPPFSHVKLAAGTAFNSTKVARLRGSTVGSRHARRATALGRP